MTLRHLRRFATSQRHACRRRAPEANLQRFRFGLGIPQSDRQPYGRVGSVREFDGTPLIYHFGHAGAGLFAAPSAVSSDLEQRFGVRLVGTATRSIRWRFYAITVGAKIRHPAVRRIVDAAHQQLFDPEPKTERGVAKEGERLHGEMSRSTR